MKEMIMVKTVFILFILISTISLAIADTTKYFCNGAVNQFFITFDTKKKLIIIGSDKPKKYWTEANYIFWHSANDYTVYEYTFKKSYNKLFGKLRVRSHHLVTSKNNWYDYECTVNQ